MREHSYQVQVRMKQGAVIGAVAGFALFGVAYMSWGTLFHLIFIPIGSLMGYFAPALLALDEDD